MDLGLREYDEAVSLYPELKGGRWTRENVQELIDQIKLNANWLAQINQEKDL